MAASQPKVNLCDPATVLFVVAPSLSIKSRVPMKLWILPLSRVYPEMDNLRLSLTDMILLNGR